MPRTKQAIIPALMVFIFGKWRHETKLRSPLEGPDRGPMTRWRHGAGAGAGAGQGGPGLGGQDLPC